mmetsp:Transcript_22540/g.47161  ORF Transcript_22540/g.47161 Transcript_22540/m.47161 type:complete len:353 (-) Transcript_22540:120-1178(-)
MARFPSTTAVVATAIAVLALHVGHSSAQPPNLPYVDAVVQPTDTTTNATSATSPETADIIDGNEAPPLRYSYVISLQYNRRHQCGGILIAHDVILTAAHCVGAFQDAVIGVHNLTDAAAVPATSSTSSAEEPSYDTGWRTGAFKNIVVHPKFDTYYYLNDLALVVLEESVKDRDDLKYVQLAKLNYDEDYWQHTPTTTPPRQPVVTGWGDIDPSPSSNVRSDVLLQMDVAYLPPEQCHDDSILYNGVTRDYTFEVFSSQYLCGNASNGISRTCGGDSGGPFIVPGTTYGGKDDLILGLVSWGVRNCPQGRPTVYTDVAFLFEWIEDNVCGLSGDVPKSFDCKKGKKSKARKR